MITTQLIFICVPRMDNQLLKFLFGGLTLEAVKSLVSVSDPGKYYCRRYYALEIGEKDGT